MSSKAMTLSLMVVAGLNLSIWGPQAKAERIAGSGSTRVDTCRTFVSDLKKGSDFTCERRRKSGSDQKLESQLTVQQITEKDEAGKDVVKEIRVNVRTEAGCDNCGVRTNGISDSLTFSGNEDIGKINSEINALVREFEDQEKSELENQIEQKKKQAAIERDQEKCLRDSDGEKFDSEEERFQCKVDKLAEMSSDGADEDEIEKYYNKNIRDQVNTLAKSDKKEDREKALEILKGLNSEALSDKIDAEIAQNIKVIEGVNSVETRLERVKTYMQTAQMFPDGHPQKALYVQQIGVRAKAELDSIQQEIQYRSTMELTKSLQTGVAADLTVTNAMNEALSRTVSTSPELMTLGMTGTTAPTTSEKSGSIKTDNEARAARVGSKPITLLSGPPVGKIEYNGITSPFAGLFSGGQGSTVQGNFVGSRGTSPYRLPGNLVNSQQPQNFMSGTQLYNQNFPLQNTIRLQ